jgi:hypothetical protein
VIALSAGARSARLAVRAGSAEEFVAREAQAAAPSGGRSDSPRERRLEGWLDHVSEGRAEGWAYDSANPDAKLKIEISTSPTHRPITRTPTLRSASESWG